MERERSKRRRKNEKDESGSNACKRCGKKRDEGGGEVEIKGIRGGTKGGGGVRKRR